MHQPQVVGQVGPEEAARLITGGAVLIDVRELEEWRFGRAPEAVHIPLGDLGARLGDLPEETTLIMICRSGNRSGVAAAALVDIGRRALNLAGGMLAWKAASLPVVADGGAAGDVA